MLFGVVLQLCSCVELVIYVMYVNMKTKILTLILHVHGAMD